MEESDINDESLYKYYFENICIIKKKNKKTDSLSYFLQNPIIIFDAKFEKNFEELRKLLLTSW